MTSAINSISTEPVEISVPSASLIELHRDNDTLGTPDALM
jgi:hypothetical protein